MAQYNLQQQVFTLSMLANGDAGIDDPSPADLANKLNARLQTLLTSQALTGLIGNWSVDWGPVVFENQTTSGTYSGVADQTMVVFKGQNPDSPSRGTVYVVAIAGTNFLSQFDITQEDGTLYPRQSLPGVNGVYISKGTSTGLQTLFAMNNNQVAGGPYAGKTLQQYLAAVQNTNATLVFTGHSLGGALAPALALSLFPNRTATGKWGNVFVYPTAGPNPGGTDFFAAYQEIFGAKVDPVNPNLTWNQLVWNTLDIVPHAWDYVNDAKSVFPVLAQLPDLYPQICTLEKTPAAHLCLSAATTAARTYATGTASLSVPIQFHPISTNPGVQGAFFSPASPGSPYPAAPTYPVPAGTLTYWFTEAMFQHIVAYFYLLQVPELLPILGCQNPFDPSAPLNTSAQNLAQTVCTKVCKEICDCSKQ
ncbi:MAG TPA: hypothetical protein VNT75_29920 [Symbiobacteriaceae bacterium]|nr:hypothetical protein [Symbiobacteriaceae bacterium]